MTGASVALGSVTADAGDATSDPAGGSGETGGPVTIKATGVAGVGAVSTRGGSGRTTGNGGTGGTVSISGDRVTTGSITTLGENLSASGGERDARLRRPRCSSAARSTPPARPVPGGNPARQGGAGGSIVLIAAHGAAHARRAPALRGRRGRQRRRAGSERRQRRDRAAVVQSIASSTGVLSGGGNGGAPGIQNGLRGAGGNGGRVRIWAQLPSLILLQLVDSTGGTGDPNGADGPQQDESAPTALSISKTRTPRFASHSPEAEGYRVFASLAGAPAKLIMETTKSGIALPKVAACVKADYTLDGLQRQRSAGRAIPSARSASWRPPPPPRPARTPRR